MRIGRNAPCPCNSGKKYKKCCLKKARVSPTVSSPTHGMDQSSRGGYVEAKGLRKSEYPGAIRIRSLSDKQLLEELSQFGITIETDGFPEQCRGYASAWELGDVWVKARQGPPELSHREKNFVCLAACSLWERLNPDCPSIEMIDDWMAEGYEKDPDSDLISSIELWQQVWHGLSRHLEPTIRSPNDLDEVFQGSEFISNWLQDFELAFENAGINSREHARMGVTFLEEALEAFPDLNDQTRLNFQKTLAELYWRSGNQESAEQTARSLIKQNKQTVRGYIALADALTNGRAANGLTPDYQETLAILEQARTLPVSDASDYDLARLIAIMKEESQASP